MASLNKKPADPEKLLQRMAALCARSEQCRHDIEEKLYKAGLPSAERDMIIERLLNDRFIDSRRYAEAVARDKVRFSGWGKRKISAFLYSKRIERVIIEEALSAIDPKDYKEALVRGAKLKARGLDLSTREGREKLIRHLGSKGFEAGLCVKITEAMTRKQLEQ